MANSHDTLVDTLTIVHAALRRGLSSIVKFSGSALDDADRAPFVDFTTRYLDFLTSHHVGEDKVLFPGLQKAFARKDSAEANEAARSARIREEELAPVVDLMKTMREQVAKVSKGGSPKALGELHEAAIKLQEALIPHLDAEEKDLGGSLLKPLMSADAVGGLNDALLGYEKKNGSAKGLMLFIHSLDAREQVVLFGDLPWILRRVIIKWIWARGYRPLLKFSYSQASAL